MNSLSPAQALGPAARRAVVYALEDRDGRVDEYVIRALRGLRDHAELIVVVVSGPLDDPGAETLAQVADDIVRRDPAGFVAGAYRAAIDSLGNRIHEFDEVVFADDSWFGPMDSFDGIFARMGAQTVDFWAMSDYIPAADESSLEEPPVGVMQAYWLAVRTRMLVGEEWRRFWEELPPLPDFDTFSREFELAFRERFTAAGFIAAVAFPASAFPTADASIFNADLLIEAGCPTMRREGLSDWPPFLDSQAVVGRWTIDAASARGYPRELILGHLARVLPPRVLNANAALLDVLDETGRAYDPGQPQRIAAVAHIFYEDLADEILDHAERLPGAVDLFVTTSDEAKAGRLRAAIAARPSRPRAVDVRVVASNDGRDQSAFLVTCRDALRGGDYDLVVKLHSKKSVQDGANNGDHFRQHQFMNLLNSRGYAANLVGLFQREPRLGLVFPPMIHVGAATLGRGWATNLPRFTETAARLGITVPLDDVSPLAPYGGMFVARPEALELLTREQWTFEQFGGEGSYGDGGLAHVLERMPVYAAAQAGYYARTVSTTEYMSVSHPSMEFKLDQISATTAGYPHEQIEFLRRAGFIGEGRLADVTQMYLRLHRPNLLRVFQPILSRTTTLGVQKRRNKTKADRA